MLLGNDGRDKSTIRLGTRNCRDCYMYHRHNKTTLKHTCFSLFYSKGQGHMKVNTCHTSGLLTDNSIIKVMGTIEIPKT